MCKLLVGIQLNDEPCEEYGQIMGAQLPETATQKDGISLLTIDKQNRTNVYRAIGDYSGVYKQLSRTLYDNRVTGLHTRIGTKGAATLENTHFYQMGDDYFAHNGIVSDYSGFNRNGKTWWDKEKPPTFDYDDFYPTYGMDKEVDEKYVEKKYEEVEKRITKCHLCVNVDQPCDNHAQDGMTLLNLGELLDKGRVGKIVIRKKTAPIANMPKDATDSYQFFANLPRPFTKHEIAKEIEVRSFNGIAVIVQPKLKQIILIATRTVKIQTDWQNYLILYSFAPEHKLKSYRWLLGLPIEQDATTKHIPVYDVPEGVYEIPYDQQEDKQFQLIPRKEVAKV